MIYNLSHLKSHLKSLLKVKTETTSESHVTHFTEIKGETHKTERVGWVKEENVNNKNQDCRGRDKNRSSNDLQMYW